MKRKLTDEEIEAQTDRANDMCQTCHESAHYMYGLANGLALIGTEDAKRAAHQLRCHADELHGTRLYVIHAYREKK